MFARTTGGELIILHVISPLSASVPMEFLQPGVLDSMEADMRRWAEQRLARLTVAAQRFGVRTSAVLVTGEPADEIIRAIGVYHADLLVVGTNARRGVAKLVLGSVAARALTTAPCPVVTVRGA